MDTTPLAQPQDVADLWRPLGTPALTAAETAAITRLIEKASAMLRQRVPDLDERLALPSTDRRALAPALVASVVAGIVKRFLVNPEGFASTTETIGPQSWSRSHSIRGDNGDVRGELLVTDSDLAALAVAGASGLIGTIRTPGRLAPFPHGRVGGPGSMDADAFLGGGPR